MFFLHFLLELTVQFISEFHRLAVQAASHISDIFHTDLWKKNVPSVLPFEFPHPAKKEALTGDESRADDDVHVLTLLGKQLHLRLDELLGHYLGVAALALSRLLEVHLQRLSTQRLELLQGRGPGG